MCTLIELIKRIIKLERVKRAMHMNRKCLRELDVLMNSVGIDCSEFEIVDVTDMFNDEDI